MVLGLRGIDIVLISLLFITALNCTLTYFCCSKSLNVLKSNKSIVSAVNKLRIYDEYILSKANIAIALLYFFICYYVISNTLPDSIYVIFFATLVSFVITLITIVSARLCYSYAANVLLDTKLNEWECIKENFKSLIVTYIPFMIFTFFIPSLLVMDIDFESKAISIGVFLLVFIVLWLLSTPKILIITLGARKIENPLLKFRLDKLFRKHKIKRYHLYSWDTSRSNESNAMVSGVFTQYVFISTTLLNEMTLPELEAIITHEIGHIKNNHLVKVLLNKIIMLMLFASLLVLPFILDLNTGPMVITYAVVIILFIASFFYSMSLERVFENQADAYSKEHSESEVFSSALAKISKYEEIEKETSRIDKLFQSHPDLKDRIKDIDS